MLSRKQQKNAGRIAWLCLFIPATLVILKLVDNRLIAGLLMSLSGALAYATVPYILRDMRIWPKIKKS